MLHKLIIFSSPVLFISLLVSIILTVTVVAVIVLFPNSDASGQTSSSPSSQSASSSPNTIQQQTWVDKLNNLKIQFGYLPEKPIIDAPTQLKFSVQNLQTDEQLKNLSARVVVLSNAGGGQQRSFKFTNITSSPDGTFSVKYLFPDSGLYNVIAKIDSKDFTSLASFNVSVPFAPLGTVNVSSILSSTVLVEISGIIAATAAAVVVLIWMKRNKRS
jgi:hypothetical protein